MRTHTKTIMLIHGLWMSPASWEPFQGFYSARGYHVIAPAWPRMDGDVAQIRRHGPVLGGLGLREIADHYAALIRCLDEEPILMGHSMGGLIVQQLLDRGIGVAGVAIDSATPRGIYQVPWSVIRSSRPALVNPLNFWREVTLTFEQFRYAFAHTMPEAEARAAYRDYVVPGPGRPVFEVALGNFIPGASNRIDWSNENRAPLLFIAGAEDRLVPASLTMANFTRYRARSTCTAYKEFPRRSHLIVAQPGWEEVADYALTWVESTLGRPDRVAPFVTHAAS